MIHKRGYYPGILILVTLMFFVYKGIAVSPVTGAGTGIADSDGHQSKIIEKVWITTTDTSVTMELQHGPLPGTVGFRVSIRHTGGDLLWEGEAEPRFIQGKHVLQLGGLDPLLWSPATPELYDLELEVRDENRIMQEINYRIGFRKIESRNGQIYLNDHPVFLRGIAINPPGRGIPPELEKSYEFALEYVRFMKSIHVNIIRIPDNENWYDACDELGMMVFGGNYSSSVKGERPPEDYDEGVEWYRHRKFHPIMHHPSLVIYALTNEVPYRGTASEKWLDFLGYAYRDLKAWDPTRLYIGNAGYGYGQSGDICDLHRYWGWYYSSPITFLHVRDYEKITSPEKVQPLTFTECVGNYTGPDGRYNLTPNHKNPVSQLNWTGHAPQDRQHDLASQHQCRVFRNATEMFRRLRRINPEISGIMPFTTTFYNWHTVQSFVDMDPKPVTRQAKSSYQPVLLSWENWTGQVFAGSTIQPRFHIVNDADDFSDLEHVTVRVSLLDKTRTEITGQTIRCPVIPYYHVFSEKTKVEIPADLPGGNYYLEGVVFAGDREVSRNDTELFIARKDFIPVFSGENTPILLYDPEGGTGHALKACGIPFTRIDGPEGLEEDACLIIGEDGADREITEHSKTIHSFIRRGGRVICLRQESTRGDFSEAMPVRIKMLTMDVDNPQYPPPVRPSANSFNINPERPDHPVFSGIGRAHLRVWSDYGDWDESKPGFPSCYPVTAGFVLENKSDIAHTAVLADYSVGLEGIALAEMFEGEGSALLTGFDLIARIGLDPVATRLFVNMVNYMTGDAGHHIHPFINAPVLWGEYETEKGVLTGIASGFMLNSKPVLTGAYKDLPLVVTQEGHQYAEKPGGWNNRAGIQYVPYGRRPFGPYYHRGFGGIPEPGGNGDPEGEGEFWCRIPAGYDAMVTTVENPAEQDLRIQIWVNGTMVNDRMIPAGEKCSLTGRFDPVTDALRVRIRGDRRFVILETAFTKQ